MENKIQFIGNVKLDFSAHDGQDFYSDGDIEDEILSHFMKGDQEDFLRNDNRFPVLYHLSSLRNLLVEWFPIKESDAILEIGCGLGALTGCLLKGNSVDAVEISPRRANICALRNFDKKNLTIHVGNLNAITFDKKFDYVFLIGVLEYAAKFTHTQNPQIDFLNKCKSLLKPDGALVIAIENRLGIEYFSGKPEDHTGRMFDGIADYPLSKGIKTFSRSELKKMLNRCGLVEQKFFYPYPDYKFPYIIHSDESLPNPYEFLHYSDDFYDMNRPMLFPISRALSTIVNADLYSEFANSFLIVARQIPSTQENFPIKIQANNCLRKIQYQLRTEFYHSDSASGLIIKKVARNVAARKHLQTLVENCGILSDIYGRECVAQIKLISEDTAEMEYVEGEIFEDYVCRALAGNNFEKFLNAFEVFYTNILRGTNFNGFFMPEGFNFDAPNRQYELDLNFRNIAIRNGNLVLFDYEFLSPSVPKKFIFYRTLMVFWHNRGEFLSQYGITLESLLDSVNFTSEELRKCEILDFDFVNSVLDFYNKKYRKIRLPFQIK